MKLAFASTILCIVSAVTLAKPTLIGDEFDLSFIEEAAESSLDPYDYDEISTFLQKRDSSGIESTIEGLLNVVNESGIVWTILDQVAYYPTRIEYIANLTAKLIGGANISSVASVVSGINLDLSDVNVSAIVSAVESSGVVQSLLDGILLDDSYRPTLANLINRVLTSRSSKNLFLYLVQDVFKSNKNSKRAETSALETFIGNILSAALSSTLVSDVAKDVLTALNETQFLTYTVKHFLADEGYQNMTAQLFIDVVRTGKVKVSGSSLNATSLASKLLGNTKIISTAVGYLLSGNINLSGLGKYTDAVKEILADVESDGAFAELNEYVFSETHTVTTPLLYTGNIVVAKTASFTFGNLNATTTTTKASSSTRTSTITSVSDSDASDFSYATSDDLNASESAAEVESILALLGATTTGSAASSSASSAISSISSAASSAVDSLSLFLETFGQSATTTTSTRTTSTRSSSRSSTTSYKSMVTVTVTRGATTTTSSTSTDEDAALASILAALGASSSADGSSKKREVISQNSGASHASVPMLLVYLQAMVFGGILML